MNKLFAIGIGLCLIGIASPTFTFAKDKKAAGKKQAATTNPLSKFDKDNNQLLDESELNAVKKDYATNKTEALKEYDSNNDGKIDDNEAAVIKTNFAPGAKKHQKKKSA